MATKDLGNDSALSTELWLRDTRVRLEPGQPLIMGILNVGLDSVADSRVFAGEDARVAQGQKLADQGAHIVDVGAISGRTDTPALSVQEEIDLVKPVVAELSASGVTVSVDTWRPQVVEAVLDAGAALINDISGLVDPAVARLAAEAGAGLVIMHTRAAPKEERFPTYEDPMADVVSFLEGRIQEARSEGVSAEQIVLDPGLDYAKTPEESVDVLGGLGQLRAFGRPVLLAVSRKYFIGAITGRLPEERFAGTLGALSFGLAHGAGIVRVHDVPGVADFLNVLLTLQGRKKVPQGWDRDDESLKWIPPKLPGT